MIPYNRGTVGPLQTDSGLLVDRRMRLVRRRQCSTWEMDRRDGLAVLSRRIIDGTGFSRAGHDDKARPVFFVTSQECERRSHDPRLAAIASGDRTTDPANCLQRYPDS